MTGKGVTAGVLVGYGSIGRLHAGLLSRRYGSTAIVDVSEGARQRAQADYPEAVVVESLEQLSERAWGWEESLAVIATWGPTHLAVFERAASLGVRHVLCEKPLASSLTAGAAMVRAARQAGVVLGSHHKISHSGFVSGLRDLAAELGIGDPEAMLVYGGAVGMVTNGLHYIDLAMELFGSGPSSVASTVLGDPLNPRSPDLMLYGGTAVWSFGGGRELTAVFSNRSSVAESTVITYRDAVVNVARNLDVEVRVRDRAEIERFPSVTRVGAASAAVHQGALPGMNTREDRIESLYQEIESGEVRVCPPESALEALGACLGALTAGATSSAVALPMDPEGDMAKREWPVS